MIQYILDKEGKEKFKKVMATTEGACIRPMTTPIHIVRKDEKYYVKEERFRDIGRLFIADTIEDVYLLLQDFGIPVNIDAIKAGVMDKIESLI